MARKKPRGRPYNRAIAAAQRWATRLHACVYRASGGRVGGRLLGSPVLLLTTRGRRSGEPRTVPLLYLRDGENLVVVASNGGTANHPGWWLNVREDPTATVEVGVSAGGTPAVPVRVEEVGGEEKERLWVRLVEMYGPYRRYRERTDREIPVVVLRPVR